MVETAGAMRVSEAGTEPLRVSPWTPMFATKLKDPVPTYTHIYGKYKNK
jgi:hypothetical protein